MKPVAMLHAVERALCAIGFLLMAVALIADVGSRLILGHGIVGAAQFGLVGMLITALFGVGLAADAGAHFRPRVLDKYCPDGWQSRVEQLGHLVTAVFFLLLTGISVQVSAESYALEDLTSLLRWPVWLLQGVFVIAFAFNAIRFLVYAFDPSARPVEEVG